MSNLVRLVGGSRDGEFMKEDRTRQQVCLPEKAATKTGDEVLAGSDAWHEVSVERYERTQMNFYNSGKFYEVYFFRHESYTDEQAHRHILENWGPRG